MEIMITLALEMSSPLGSIALFEEETLIENVDCGAYRRGQQRLFSAIDTLLRGRSLCVADVAQIAVGRGPGNYSGMRVGFAIAEGLAAPHGTKVLAVSSGRALALRIVNTAVSKTVAVVGDARREQFWMGGFELVDGSLKTRKDWALYSAASLLEVLEPGLTVVSSEWDRLDEKLGLQHVPGLHSIKHSCYPTAIDVGRLLLQEGAAGIKSEPPVPLYMHPPVFVPTQKDGQNGT